MDITNTASEVFIGENSLISKKIEEINLNKDEFGELQIQITISGFSKKSNYFKIKLLFTEVVEFKFYYSNIYNFYNIENYKLSYIEDQIYVSFDPDENEEKSKGDSDFIIAKKLELYSLE